METRRKDSWRAKICFRVAGPHGEVDDIWAGEDQGCGRCWGVEGGGGRLELGWGRMEVITWDGREDISEWGRWKAADR